MLLSAKQAHDLAPLALKLLAAFRDPSSPQWSEQWSPLEWRGLKFNNRLGLAGGVDKDGASIEDWWTFGPGFIEIGTVTPFGQGPNPGKIIDRDGANFTLWNKMGFPGKGAEHVRANLDDLPPDRVTPVFVNIGKNRDTPNEQAMIDYVKCIDIIGDRADAWVVNISSPNTTGLRDLFQPERFRPFLGGILDARKEKTTKRAPVLLKLSPDLTEGELAAVVSTAIELKIDGLIATNTTLAREPGSPFPNDGGVSGRPLAARSKDVLKKVIALAGPYRRDLLVISAGGILTPEDVFERLALGADLAQVYAALVFAGPWFFERTASHAARH